MDKPDKPHPPMETALVLLRASRPAAWPVLPVVFIAGFLISSSSFSPAALIQVFLLSAPFGIFYAFNDIHDYSSDKLNPRKRGIGGASLHPSHAPLIKKAAISIFLLLVASSIFTFNPANLMLMLLLLFFAYSYSAPPLRLKERPPLDSLTNGLGYYLLPFLLGFSFGAPILTASPHILFPALCFASVHAFSTIMDYSSDKKAKNTTFSIKFGKKAATVFPMSAAIITVLFADFSAFNPTAFSAELMRIYLSTCALIFLFNLFIDWKLLMQFPKLKNFAKFFKTNEEISKNSLYLVYLGFLLTAAAYLLHKL